MRSLLAIVLLVMGCGGETTTPLPPLEVVNEVHTFFVVPVTGSFARLEAAQDSILMERALSQAWMHEHFGRWINYASGFSLLRVADTSGDPHRSIELAVQSKLARGDVALVYYDGPTTSPNCGGAAVGGRVAILYVGNCRLPFLRRRPGASIGSGFWIFAAVHDLGHSFGVEHHDERGYLMYGGTHGVPHLGALPETKLAFEASGYLE